MTKSEIKSIIDIEIFKEQNIVLRRDFLMDGLNRASTDYDLIIKNGTLVDGTGNTAKTGNIAIKGWKNSSCW